MAICKFCEQTFKKVASHQYVCKANPDRVMPKNQHSHGDYVVRESTKLKLANSARNNMADPELRKKISNAVSKTVQEKVKSGEWHNSFSRSRCYDYKGIRLYGKWELAYAEYLDRRGIRWKRPNETFPYEFEGKSRMYTPDFYLIDSNQWVEIKGYPTKKDFAKWKHFPYDLTVLFGQDLFDLGLIATFKKFSVSLA